MLDVVQYLLQQGSDPKRKDEFGRTARDRIASGKLGMYSIPNVDEIRNALEAAGG
jgi:hypothetical protein